MKEKLDSAVMTIELTLLSVIQGVALYFLADNARAAIIALDYAHFVYIAIAFMLFIIFWSQALVHVLSFISWPIEFIHNFLYFLVVISEVVLFASIDNPLHWFAANAGFFFLSGLLYYADLRLLLSKKGNFQTDAQKAFYERILKDQKLALGVLVPVGFAYCIACSILISGNPDFFIARNGHLILGGIQALLALGSTAYLVSTFKEHVALIEHL